MSLRNSKLNDITTNNKDIHSLCARTECFDHWISVSSVKADVFHSCWTCFPQAIILINGNMKRLKYEGLNLQYDFGSCVVLEISANIGDSVRQGRCLEWLVALRCHEQQKKLFWASKKAESEIRHLLVYKIEPKMIFEMIAKEKDNKL